MALDCCEESSIVKRSWFGTGRNISEIEVLLLAGVFSEWIFGSSRGKVQNGPDLGSTHVSLQVGHFLL